MNTNLECELIHKLAAELKFELSDEQCRLIQKDFQVILEQMKVVSAIDTNNIEPLDYLFVTNNTYLREDEVVIFNEHQLVLENAPVVEKDYIVINKVVE